MFSAILTRPHRLRKPRRDRVRQAAYREAYAVPNRDQVSKHGADRVNVMTDPDARRRLDRDERARAAANARASVRLDDRDPAAAEPDVAAWVEGQIDTDELIRGARVRAAPRADPDAAP